VTPSRASAASLFALEGAPLDAVKLVAAAAMVSDHVNDILLDHDHLAM